MNIVFREWETCYLLEIHGRVDGLTASEIKQAIDKITSMGHRRLIVDFSGVTFMSSAGLRVILQTHKSLKTIGGELILLSVPDPVAAVFRISGLEKVMTFMADFSSLKAYLSPEPERILTELFDLNGVKYSFQKLESVDGTIFPVGSSVKLLSSGYTAEDVIRIRQSEISFGAGLAVLGDDFGDFKNLFGESIVINHHFFSYPAVKRPMIDYAIHLVSSPQTLNFFTGFGITGSFTGILRVEDQNLSVTLEDLIQAANQVAGSACYGIVILSLSGGLMGMNLKRAPIAENSPHTGDIFDPGICHQWMNFSLEEEDMNKTIMAVGIVKKNDEVPDRKKDILFPGQSAHHIHALVLQNGLIRNTGADMIRELDRVIQEFTAEKVVHLLPSAKFKGGFVGLINLKSN